MAGTILGLTDKELQMCRPGNFDFLDQEGMAKP